MKVRVSLNVTFLKQPFSTGPLVLHPLGIRVSVISEFSTDGLDENQKAEVVRSSCSSTGVSPRRSQISADAPLLSKLS